MTAPNDLDRQLDAFLLDGPTELPDPSFDAVRDHIEMTGQRVVIGPWRMPDMNKLVPLGAGIAAVAVVAVLGTQLLAAPAPGGVGAVPSVPPSPPPAPSATPAPSPSPSPTSEPAAFPAKYALTPEGVDGFTFTFDAPATWDEFEGLGVWIDGNAPPDGAALFIYRGGDLYREPCLTGDEAEADADIPVGPKVDDFVTALVDHPSLDVTSPVDVTLAGFSGKYLDLLVPNDISACAYYKPVDGHHYAQGPGHRWHLWVLDVGGNRVLVETNDYAGTSAQRLAEEQAMIDSLEINP